ncbi:MAG: YicC/YloC family endoribonuclease [Planctomycetota bacterium]
MIQSMTGYGHAEGEVNGVTYVVEIKTVNNRYFKTIIKVPETATFLEGQVEKLLRRNLSRGTVNYVLRLKNAPVEMLFQIDETALRGAVEQLSGLMGSVDARGALDIASLLNLPGIVVPASPDEEAADQMKEAVLGLTQEALEKLKQMRSAEGFALAADLEGHCQIMKQQLEQIRGRHAVVAGEYQEKLKKRVDDLLANVGVTLDEDTLAREVAVFADRSDISEEMARLDFHLKQFVESCQREDQAGRRLEFITQEMLREANTIASKASDREVGRCVVEIKCRIDRIKEQVQNVE